MNLYKLYGTAMVYGTALVVIAANNEAEAMEVCLKDEDLLNDWEYDENGDKVPPRLNPYYFDIHDYPVKIEGVTVQCDSPRIIAQARYAE